MTSLSRRSFLARRATRAGSGTDAASRHGSTARRGGLVARVLHRDPLASVRENYRGDCIPGEFGIRLEDCWHMTAAGPKLFTPLARSLEQPV
jgi:hypothetical protein